jgi:hypothetical protein
MDPEDWPDEDGWSDEEGLSHCRCLQKGLLCDNPSSHDENLFWRAAETRKQHFYVPYQEYPHTVITCWRCGKRHRFAHREDAYDFLNDGQCDCQKEATHGPDVQPL